MRTIDDFEQITQDAIQTGNREIIEATIAEFVDLFDYIDNGRMLDGSVQGEMIKQRTLDRIRNCIVLLENYIK